MKMMKTPPFLLFLLILICSISISHAQSLSSKWSSEYEFKRGINHAVGFDGQFYSFYKVDGDERILVKCDKDLSKITTFKIPPTFLKKEHQGKIEDIFQTENDIYVGISKMVFKNNWTYNLHKINFSEDGKPTGSDNVEIYSCPWGSSTNMPQFTIEKSPDGSKTVLLTEHAIEKKRETSVIGITVMEGTTIISSSTYELDFRSRKMTKYIIQVNNSGNVILKTRFKEKNWVSWYWFLGAESTNLQKIEPPADHTIIRIESITDENKTTQILGTLQKVIPTPEGASNVYYHTSIFNVNVTDQKLDAMQVTPFPDELLTNYYSLDSLTSMHKKVKNLSLHSIHQFENGDKLVLLEKYKYAKELIPNQASGSSPKYYHHYERGKIIAFCLENNSSTIKWHKILNKNQKRTESQKLSGGQNYPPRLSFIAQCVDNKVYILYNKSDNKSEKAIGGNITQSTGDNQIHPIVMTVLDANGEIVLGNEDRGNYQSQFFGPGESTSMYLRSTPMIHLEDGSIVVSAVNYFGKHVRFGVIKFNP